ncbi:hypothetical protein DSM106972_070120 [Dulcicalothrix desertica PCC 7102]|uniref:Uncharacterized protein n=1 Tax=Dulcicalothrix desertica PCC 7102 TaxID=232991 RepID=A0A3S1AHM5_9CYAN|nr:hypothetical protein [Dulcicalothrix desertica]RUT01006.1 hypothetical protein DSM106972_070120 [Dulcicalothrix desertica PCC 7102]TWH39220.1 hypothetical protein CAL7102_08435 [Dulcicalothrix desertica PCC 7102]
MKWKNLSFLTCGFVLSTTISFIFTSVVNANSSTNLNPSLVPESGKTAQDFVPSGWKLQDKVDGDINNDRQLDTVLTLIQAGTQNDERVRGLVVLVKQSNGQLRRLAVANKLLLCSSCGGLLAGSDGVGSNIEIKKGVITISQLSGSRLARETKHRFWIDKSSGRLVLIGKDILDFDRGNGDSTLVSSNYLTGQQIVEKSQRQKVVSTKKSTIPKTKQFIETVNIETN